MIPFDRRPVSGVPLDRGAPASEGVDTAPGGTGKSYSRQGTLPPPEWTSGSGVVRTTVAPRPLARRMGGRADQAWMRARVDEARRADDPPALRAACVELARWLASRDRDLDEAVQLAATALSLGEDTELRREMAAWLESLGQSSRAAAALKPIASMADVESQEASYVLVRTGILKARADEPAGAAAAFDAALSIDAGDALPAELLGAISAWQPDAVPPAEAALAYVEGARRRAAAGQDESELEDLWRAFSTDPASDAVIEALARALEAMGRTEAAREARLAHEQARGSIDPEKALPDLEDAPTPTPALDLRAIAARADIALEGRDRESAAALERAIGAVGPRVVWCLALAEMLAALGDVELSVGWTQRCVALRPGDQQVVVRLLDRLLLLADPWRLGDALAWLLAQPQPASWLAEPFARALRALAHLDPDRAAVVARRTLDVLGPEPMALREAMLEVAAKASDEAFKAAIFERWLSCGAVGADRRMLYAELAQLRLHLGDDESLARVVARAIREGLSSNAIDAHLEHLLERPATPDAQLWRMEAKAQRLAAAGDVDATVWAWREFGAGLWDLADDRARAIEAWQVAARVAGRFGYTTLALDLVAFADQRFAFDWLRKAVDAELDDAGAATIAVAASRAALSIAEFRAAFDFAARGLARAPARGDALEIAERSATQPDDHAALSGIYELVASRALGRFGRRAAHYRGARFFERRGDHGLALKHAAQAFYAVPSEGSSFQLLARAAERAGDRAHAMQTIEMVADRVDRSEARTAWLLRAASIAGEGEEGARRKIDVLLRAAVSSPTVAVIALLRDAGRDLLRYGPEERLVLEMRLGRAAQSITGRLDGPEGARVAIAFARTSLELFADAGSAFSSMERAFACDGDVDEFAELTPWGAALGAVDGARNRAAALLASAETAHANLGIGSLRLLSAVASAAGDDALRARTAVAAALRDPDDDAAVIEADAASRAFPELEERLAGRVPRARRAEAVRAEARARAGNGAHADAATLFERAIELSDEAARPDIERELRAAWEAAGRSAEIEARVQRDAASEGASPQARADHWTEIAERREARGDKAGAVRALTEACKLDPEPLERWSALERVAEAEGDDAARVTALEAIAMRVGARGRVAVFKRLARAHERRNDPGAAERAWQRVLALDPEDEEADHAVEAAIVEHGRYDDLAEHLAHRAERLSGQSEKKEMLRAVRLRRAAILEQRLGRIEDACEELARLLAEWPSSPGALRYLADLRERRGEHGRAAPLWERAAALETDPAGRDELEVRAGRAALAAGDVPAALAHAARVRPIGPAYQGALEIRVEVARGVGEDSALGDALEALAAAETVDAVTRSQLLLEAAQAAARAGDPRGAHERATRAAMAAPDRATPQLLARALEYRLRGAGAPDEARRTIEELAGIREEIEGPDAALRAFLMAEALDVVQGRGAGLRELEEARAHIGDHPLIGLGLAERFAATGQDEMAVDEYRVALRGSLLELRKIGNVALHAAESAARAGRDQDAAHFLDLAQTDPDSRTQAQKLRARLIERAGPPQLEQPPVSAPGDDLRLEEMEAAVRVARTSVARASARLALGRARLEVHDPIGAEPLLWEALADGLAESGDVLAPLLSGTSDRARDLVRLRRQQVALEPGDVGRLELLRAAALADDDRVYARAVEHVLRAFDPGAGPLPPPPLATQPEQPGIFALLTRPSRDAAGEATAALWESAPHLFARDPNNYGIAGLERVVPGPTSAVGRLYEVALRLLDLPRIPVYLTRSTTIAPSVQVALLAPPSVLLAGDVREEGTALRFAFGWGLSAAMPQNVLRLAVTPTEGTALIEAIRAAFGPPDIGRRVDAHAARLAQSFWQTVPARTQRRLQELLGASPFPDHAELAARADQSGRRVGMFLAGDFSYAARQVVSDAPLRDRDAGALSLGTLRSLCEELPSLADLLRLAVSPEYAEARWHVVAPTAQRGMLSSGRFSLY